MHHRTGHLWDDNTFGHFMEIIKGGAASFIRLDKLAILAITSANGNPLFQLALECKDTIQTMKLWFYQDGNNGVDWSFLNRLDEFHHSSSFTLDAAIGSTKSLDKMLDSCPHLRAVIICGIVPFASFQRGYT